MMVTILPGKVTQLEDALVQIRCGAVRRQGPAKSGGAFSFPRTESKDDVTFRVDLLQRLGTGHILHKPSDGTPRRHQVVLGDSGLSCEVEVSESDQEAMPIPADQPDQVVCTIGGSTGGSGIAGAVSAKVYFESSGVLRVIQGLMLIVAKQRPKDPFAFMGRLLLNGYDGGEQDAAVAEPTLAPALVIERPLCMAASATPEMRRRQWQEPEKWSMSLDQLHDVLDHCAATEAYSRLKRQDAQARQLREQDGSVSMYCINDGFVKPWSMGTGCGLSILTNPDHGLDAQLMLSHAWGEDMEEFQGALRIWQVENNAHNSLRVWFCLFANYQCQDGVGPDIPVQLRMDPFARVIGSQSVKSALGGRGILAVHTTTCDLYSRLWCVHEVERATAAEDVDVAAALSDAYTIGIVKEVGFVLENQGTYESALDAAGVTVRSAQATCSRVEDRQMLLRKILATKGQFNHLDAVICDFRKQTLPDHVLWDLTKAGMPLDKIDRHDKKLTVAIMACGCMGLDRLGQVKGKLWDDPALQLLACRALTSKSLLDDLANRFSNPAAGVPDAAVQALAQIAVQAPAAVPTLFRLLWHDKWRKIRVDVVRAVGEMGDLAPPEVVPALIGRLSDKEKVVRTSAWEALERMTGTLVDAFPAVLALLDNEAPKMRQGLAKTLGLLGERAPADVVSALVRGLGDQCQEMRAAAAEALGQMGARAAAAGPEILAGLAADDANLREGAAKALGCLGDRAPIEAIAVLVERHADEDAGVRSAAEEALQRLIRRAAGAAPAIIVLAAHGESRVRQAAAMVIGHFYDDAAAAGAVPVLLRLLEDGDAAVRLAASWALGQMSGQAATAGHAILSLVTHDAPHAREGAAMALGRLGERAPPGAARALEKLCGDAHADVAAVALEALGNLGRQALEVAPSIVAFTAARSSRTRRCAAKALGGLGKIAPAAAVPALIERLGDDDVDVLLAALDALGLMDGRLSAAGRAVVSLLAHDAGRVQQGAAKLLGKMGVLAPPEAFPALIERLGDKDRAIRTAASEALGRLGPLPMAATPAVLALLRHDARLARQAAARAIGELGELAPPEAVPALIELLADKDREVRIAASEATGHIGGRTAAVVFEILPLLEHSDFLARHGAVKALAQLGAGSPPEAAPALMARLGDVSREVRTDAAEALQQMDSQLLATADVVIKLLEHELWQVRCGAARALGRMGDRAPAAALPALVGLLGHKGADVRAAAAEALGLIIGEDVASVTSAIYSMLTHEDWRCREGAAKAFGCLGARSPPEAVPMLIELLSGKAHDVRAAAAEALGRMGDESTVAAPAIVSLLSHDAWQSRHGAALALGHLCERAPPETIPALIERLVDEVGEVRTAASQSLTLMAAQVMAAAPAIILRLTHDDWKVRQSAVKALGQLGEHATHEATPALLDLLGDKDKEVRASVAEALALVAIPAEAAAPAILAQLAHDDFRVRHGAAMALERLGERAPPEAIPALIARLGDKKDVRAVALQALERLRGHTAAAAPEIIPLLAHDDWQVRQGAAVALGSLGDGAPPAAVPALIPSLADPEAEVRATALEALVRFGDRAALAGPSLLALLTHEAAQTRRGAAQVLGVLGDRAPLEAVRALVERLGDGDHDVRTSASEALGRFGRRITDVGPAILPFLAHGDPMVRHGAAKALGHFGERAPSEAVPALEGLLEGQDPDARAAALEALAKMGALAAPATPSMIALLSHEHWQTRQSAAEALGRLSEVAPPSAAPELAERLVADHRSEVRTAAAEALGRLLTAGVFRATALAPPLRRGLQADDPSVQAKCLLALGQAAIGAAATAPSLVNELAQRISATPTEVERLVEDVHRGDIDAARRLSRPPPAPPRPAAVSRTWPSIPARNVAVP